MVGSQPSTSRDYGDVIHQALLSLLETLPPALGEAIRLGAVPHWFDLPLLEQITGSAAASAAALEELASLRFAQPDPSGRFTYDPAIRALLLRDLAQKAPARFLSANRAALAGFRERAKEAAPEEAPVLRRQIIYHQLIVDEAAGLEQLCEAFEAAYDQRQFGAAEDLLTLAGETGAFLSETGQAWLRYFTARLDLAARRGDCGAAAFAEIAASAPGPLPALCEWSMGEISLLERQWTQAIRQFKGALAVVRRERNGLYLSRVQLSIGSAYLDLAEHSGGLQPESWHPRRSRLVRFFEVIFNLPFMLVEWLLRRVDWLPDGWYAGTNYQDWIIYYLLDQASRWFRRAEKQFRQNLDEQGRVEALLPLARIAFLLNRWSRAEKNYQALLAMAPVTASRYRTARVLLGLAELRNRGGKPDARAAQYALETFQYFRSRSLAAAAANQLGQAHHRLGRVEEAAQAFLTSLFLYKETGDTLLGTPVAWTLERLLGEPGLSAETRQRIAAAAQHAGRRAYLARFPHRLLRWFRQMALWGAVPFTCLLYLLAGWGLLFGIVQLEFLLHWSPAEHPELYQPQVVLTILAFTFLPYVLVFWLYRLVYSLFGLAMVHLLGRRLADIEQGQPEIIETDSDRLVVVARGAGTSRVFVWGAVDRLVTVNYCLLQRPIRLISRLLLASGSRRLILEGITHGYNHLQADIAGRLAPETQRQALSFSFLGSPWTPAALLMSIVYAFVALDRGVYMTYWGQELVFALIFLFSYVAMPFFYSSVTLWRLVAFRRKAKKILGAHADGWPAWVLWLAAAVMTVVTVVLLAGAVLYLLTG